MPFTQLYLVNDLWQVNERKKNINIFLFVTIHNYTEYNQQ